MPHTSDIIRNRKTITTTDVVFNELPFGEDITKVIQAFDEKYEKDTQRLRQKKDMVLFELEISPKPHKYSRCVYKDCKVMTYSTYCKHCEYERWCD